MTWARGGGRLTPPSWFISWQPGSKAWGLPGWPHSPGTRPRPLGLGPAPRTRPRPPGTRPLLSRRSEPSCSLSRESPGRWCFRLDSRPWRTPWPASHFCSIVGPCLLHCDPVGRPRFWGSPLSSHQRGSAVSQHLAGLVLCLVPEAGLSYTHAAQEMTFALLHLWRLGFWRPQNRVVLLLPLSQKKPQIGRAHV